MPDLGVLDQKMAYLFMLRIEFEKNYCHFCNHEPQICLIRNFCEEISISKFVTKNALSGYFSIKNGMFTDFSVRLLKVLLRYLKSLPSILFNCKIL